MQASGKINVIILDDHQSIVDGYVLRLGKNPQIEIVAALAFGDELSDDLRGVRGPQAGCQRHLAQQIAPQPG